MKDILKDWLKPKEKEVSLRSTSLELIIKEKGYIKTKELQLLRRDLLEKEGELKGKLGKLSIIKILFELYPTEVKKTGEVGIKESSFYEVDVVMVQIEIKNKENKGNIRSMLLSLCLKYKFLKLKGNSEAMGTSPTNSGNTTKKKATTFKLPVEKSITEVVSRSMAEEASRKKIIEIVEAYKKLPTLSFSEREIKRRSPLIKELQPLIEELKIEKELGEDMTTIVIKMNRTETIKKRYIKEIVRDIELPTGILKGELKTYMEILPLFKILESERSRTFERNEKIYRLTYKENYIKKVGDKRRIIGQVVRLLKKLNETHKYLTFEKEVG